MALELGQIEVRPTPLLQLPLGVVEKVQPEVEKAARHWLAIYLDVPLVKVPAARTDEQGGDLVVEPVLFALWTGEADAPLDGVDQVDLALNEVRSRR